MECVYIGPEEKPNVVPDYAEIWYYIRACRAHVMRDAERRVILAAQGAAHAAKTRMETRELTASLHTLLNQARSQALYRCFAETGGPVFSREKEKFACLLQEQERNLENEKDC